MHEGLHQPEFLPVALRESSDGTGEVQVEALCQTLDRPGRDGPADLSEVLQQRAPLDATFQAELAGDVADPAAQLRSCRSRILPEHGDLTGGRADDVEQQSQGCCLAGPIGADEPEHAAPLNPQVESVQRRVRAVALRERTSVDRQSHGGGSSHIQVDGSDGIYAIGGSGS